MTVEVYMDSRKMSVPRSDRVIGCEGDVGVNRVNFRCPRYCDGTDLNGMAAQVHYVNAGGDRDYTPAVDVEADDDSIAFSWRVTGLACAKAGRVTASVKFRDGSREWNSGIGTFAVKPAYEFDPAGDQLVDSDGDVVVVREMEGDDDGE